MNGAGGPLTQDWEPVVVRKKAPSASAKKDDKAVNDARRAGAPIETVKKYAAGSNKAASSVTGMNTKKLDEETEVLAHEKVSSSLKKLIVDTRLAKKWTRDELSRRINEKPHVVREYESGTAIPSQHIILKLERELGVKLSGHALKK